VVELVKNAYDAGARHATVELVTEEPRRLIVADDGSGMTEDEFRHNWMRPGFSEKARNPGQPIKASGRNRVPVGEKGLGRLAAGRLGERLLIYTKKESEPDWFQLTIDWPRFDDMDENLTKVRFRGRRVLDVPEQAYTHGTVLVIEEMTVDLTAKIRGRKVAGRPDTRFGRLAQDLRLLTTTSAAGTQQNFEIDLIVDDPSLVQYAGTFAGNAALTDGQFRFDFDIGLGQGGRPRIKRLVIRGGAELPDGRVIPDGQVIIDTEGYAGDIETVSYARHPERAIAGKISGSLVYAPPARGQRAPEMPGVFLYRDGVRVEPYGEPESDWLGAYSRKASRQGHAPIQPKYLFGAIHIGRASNPKLIDMSNRQGLIENDEFENLLELVRAEFGFFGQVIQDHQTTPRWAESQARKRQEAAQQRVEVSRSQSRSFAHAVRQPLTGIDAEVFTLTRIAKNDRMPADLRDLLLELADRLHRAASDISERVDTFLLASDEEVTDFAIAEVFDEVRVRLSGVCNSLNASIEVEATDLYVSFARGVLTEAIVELATNACAADDVPNRPREITLSAQNVSGEVDLSVADNGPGLPEGRRERLFERGVTTSGRPGHGLVAQKLNLLGAGGDLVLKDSTEDGTTFLVRVPTSSATLRMDGE
jgi:signal transduction histidine kinase